MALPTPTAARWLSAINDRSEVVDVANAAKLLKDLPNKVHDILGIVVAVNLHTQTGRD